MKFLVVLVDILHGSSIFVVLSTVRAEPKSSNTLKRNLKLVAQIRLEIGETLSVTIRVSQVAD